MHRAGAIDRARRYSHYVDDCLAVRPDLLDGWDLSPPRLNDDRLVGVTDYDDFLRALRRERHRCLVAIAVRDLVGLCDLEQTMAETSGLADGLIACALAWSRGRLTERWGLPNPDQGLPDQDLCVIAMGKLGGRELNFSSDIDLIFAYPDDGETKGGERSISHGEYFGKLGQTLNNALAATTADGFVYRVDMRLRPFGSAGDLAQSFAALDHYYQVHGRPWERHALVKARCLTGRPQDGVRLDGILRPFVYRRYADFTMLDSLRDLKRMIVEDAARKGAEADIKLGAGGIRDVEFIVQSFQLVHGGRDATLRTRSLLGALAVLTERGYLGAQTGEDLACGYRFLRRVENRLQMWNDEQTHALPTDPAQSVLLAESMGFTDAGDFQRQLARHQADIAAVFDSVFGAPKVVTSDIAAHPPDGWGRHLAAFAASPQRVAQSPTDGARLDAVLPLILEEIRGQNGDEATLAPVLAVLTATLRRSVYLVLLLESAAARTLLVTLCAASPWLATVLATTPDLLDQLLDPRQLFDLTDRAGLEAELRAQTASAADDDEAFLDGLRNFKRAQVFRVAAGDLTGRLPLMKVSDHLTWIAEAVVAVTLDWINAKMVSAHGSPAGWDGADGVPLVVVGFGKLGGLEMGYGSDLDMVFLSPDIDPVEMSAGPHRLENAIYLLRMAQKLMRALNTLMASGTVYEIDTQLRPHGKAGMLVNTLSGFFAYEARQAWVWEHQALLRTRAIAGAPKVRAQFERDRALFLCRSRDKAALADDVRSMRARMRTHLDRSTAALFDIKQGPGGIIDVEFLVQYLCLLGAHDHPTLVTHSDNIRQLAALADAGSLTANQADELAEIYKFWRSHAHRLALSEAEAMLPQHDAQEKARRVIAIWQQVMANYSP